MSQKPDDLSAVKAICDALEPFDEINRERIIRWASERLGLKNPIQNALPSSSGSIPPAASQQPIHEHITHTRAKDIKTFLEEKNPTSANQLVAAVAYYHKFEAPPTERKDSITTDDLMEACRKANRERPKFAAQILINASSFGLVDKVSTGTYEINAVGENLVAVSMPTVGHGNSSSRKNSSSGKKAVSKKAAKPKKAAAKKK